MPWSGAGTYSLPPAYSPEVNGTTIDAARYNGLTSDVASGITACLAKNGENVPTANLPMGGFKHTGAADASATGQYIAFNQATAVGSLTITALTVTSATGDRFIVTGSTVPANGIYLSAANTLAFASNTTARATVNSTGNWVFNAPSSGNTAQFNGAAIAGYFNRTTAGSALYVASLNTTEVFTQEIGSDAGDSPNIGYYAVNWTTGSAEWHLRMGGSTSASTVLKVNELGNFTLSAPSSGTTLTTNGVAGAITALFNGGNTAGTVLQINNSGTLLAYIGAGGGGALSSGAGTDLAFRAANASGNMLFGTGGDNTRFVITSDGRLYGTALHNNAGAVTGTTNQYIASGTYVPTATNLTNVSAATGLKSQWIRVGNIVTVTGSVNIDVSSTGGASVEIPLPIASTLSSGNNLNGTGSSSNTNHTSLGVFGSAVTNNAIYSLNATADPGSVGHRFCFSYEVL